MQRRRIMRTARQVPVTVSGTDAAGNTFVQSTTTVNVSSRGVHLMGIGCLRGVGDTVELQYRKRQATYRVAWIGAKSTWLEGHAGLEAVDGGQFMFSDMTPAPAVEAAGGDAVESPSPSPPAHSAEERRVIERRGVERRKHPRFPCAGDAQIRCGGPPVNVRVNEISAGGCYMEMLCPFPVGSKLQIEMKLLGRTLSCAAEVRSSQQHFGMGVQFTSLSPEDVAALGRVLAELAGEPSEPQPDLPPTPPVLTADRQPLADAVLCWFATHESLSRQEFLEMFRKTSTAVELADRITL